MAEYTITRDEYNKLKSQGMSAEQIGSGLRNGTIQSASTPANNSYANNAITAGGIWGYNPSPVVDKTYNALSDGSYVDELKRAMVMNDPNLDPRAKSVLGNGMNNYWDDNLDKQAMDRINSLSANGKEASQEEMANMYLYNVFQNLSEDDQNEIYRRLQADLPTGQGDAGNVDIRNRVNEYLYGGITGYDENNQAVRGGNGFESRYNTANATSKEYGNASEAVQGYESKIKDMEAEADRYAKQFSSDPTSQVYRDRYAEKTTDDPGYNALVKEWNKTQEEAKIRELFNDYDTDFETLYASYQRLLDAQRKDELNRNAPAGSADTMDWDNTYNQTTTTNGMPLGQYPGDTGFAGEIFNIFGIPYNGR